MHFITGGRGTSVQETQDEFCRHFLGCDAYPGYGFWAVMEVDGRLPRLVHLRPAPDGGRPVSRSSATGSADPRGARSMPPRVPGR